MSEKKFGKRLLTWALVAVMMISALPLNALADFEEEPYAPQEETGEEQYGISAYAGNVNVNITRGNSGSSTSTYDVYYSVNGGALQTFNGSYIDSSASTPYSVVFFVAPKPGYAIAKIRHTYGSNNAANGKFYSIVDSTDVTKCAYYSYATAVGDGAVYNGTLLASDLQTAITAAKAKGCVAAFQYSRTGAGAIGVVLDFYTEQLPTLKKDIVSITRNGQQLGLDSKVLVGDVIRYSFTVEYNGGIGDGALTYTNVNVYDEKLEQPNIAFSDYVSTTAAYTVTEYADYTVQAKDITGDVLSNTATLSYTYTSPFNTAPGSDESSATKNIATYSSVIYKYDGVVPSAAPDLNAINHEVTAIIDGTPVTVDETVKDIVGYHFSGWTTSSNVHVENGQFTMPAENVIFTGSWMANTDVPYTVHYYEEGTTNKVAADKVVENQTFDSFVTETAAAVEHYRVLGTGVQTVKLDAYNKEIIFYYRSTIVTVTFDANGGTWTALSNGSAYTLNESKNMATQQVEASSKPAVVSPTPVNPGFTFDGWYLGNDRLYVNFVPVGDTDITLVAHWKPTAAAAYTVVYTDGLTTNKAFADQSTGGLSAGAKTPAFVGTPERSGYVFTGWTPAVADKVAAPTDGGTVITYTATWEVDNWNSNDNTETGGDGIPDKRQALVKFLPGDPNGTVSGKTTQVITLPEGAESVKLGEVEGFAVAEADANEGFRFNVWTMNKTNDETADEAATAVSPLAQSVRAGSKTTFFAHFEQLPANSADVYYTVTYTDGVGGSAFADQSSHVKSGEATPAFSGTPSRAGYRFLRWEPTVSATVTGDVTYTAQWEQIKYTIKWIDEGNSRIHKEVSDVPHGTTAEAVKNMAPENPTKASDGVYKYTFIGWLETYEDVTGHQVYTAQYSKELIYTPGPVTPVYPPVGPSVPPTVEIEDDDALGLNTTDHFAYIIGYPDGTVQPGGQITRAEVATIFFRLLTDDVREENFTHTNPYSDVAGTAWYNNAVSTLSAMGIITGYPDGTFRPNASITRAEFAAIAARFDNDGDKTAAAFSDIANHWAKDEISVAYNNGWVDGYPDGTFGPQRSITRAETMTLVNRVLNRKPETEDDLLPDMVTWTDNADKKAWYYLAVQEATNSHYYEFKTNSEYEKWTELRENRDWSQLEK